MTSPFEMSSGEEDKLIEANLPKELDPDAVYFVKRAGPLLLDPATSWTTPNVHCLTNCLARDKDTRQFYNLRILTKPKPGELTEDDIQGNILIHTEFSLLKALEGVEGVVRQLGMYTDEAKSEIEIDGKGYLTEETHRRLILKMECYTPHEFSIEYTRIINLQHLVIRMKRIPESQTIKIFHNIMKIVAELHAKHIVHRDLKLGNVIVNKDSLDVKLTNFGLGKQLIREYEKLHDQRGSPAYVSPEVLNLKGYTGKPSDMWALGVCLYTMLYGHFPFVAETQLDLFKKIKKVEYKIPEQPKVSMQSVQLIKSLLVRDPNKRLKAPQAIKKLEEILKLDSIIFDLTPRVVPGASTSSTSNVCLGHSPQCACGKIKNLVVDLANALNIDLSSITLKRRAQEKIEEETQAKLGKMEEELWYIV